MAGLLLPRSRKVITNGQDSATPLCGNGAAGIDGAVVVTVEHVLEVESQVPLPGNVRGGGVEPRVAWRAAIEREWTVDHVLSRGIFQAATQLDPPGPEAVARQRLERAEVVGGPDRRGASRQLGDRLPHRARNRRG